LNLGLAIDKNPDLNIFLFLKKTEFLNTEVLSPQCKD